MSKQELLKFALARFMNTDEVQFYYYKKDGTERQATGTLHPTLIQNDGGKMPESKRDTPDHIFNYYDLGVSGWRSFDIDNLIEMSVAV